LIAHLNIVYAKNNSNIKWIHLGGSYGGNMAAWYRLKYPEMGVGGIAISGPVEATLDYTGFFTVEGMNFPSACLNWTRRAVAELDTYLADEGAGWKKITTDFNIVFNGTDTHLSRALWVFQLAWDIIDDRQICPSGNTTLTPYQTLVNAYTVLHPRTPELTYITYEASTVINMYSWLWYYQTCTEMGYYQTGSDFLNNPYQIQSSFLTPDLFVQACYDGYGVPKDAVSKNIDFANTVYGGKGITTSNTFFTHGNDDGWSAAGITKGPVPVIGNQVYVIDKGTHCSDLYFPNSSDSPSLKQAQQAHVDQIKAWISA